MLKPLKTSAFLTLLTALMLLLTTSMVSAIEVPNLYRASVIISNQSSQARTTAQRDVFTKVLVKVSGNHDVLANETVKSAVRKASQYLNQYRFIRDDNNELTLEASFDQGKVNRLLRQESLPIWGKRRPSVLMWMAGEDSDTLTRQVISKESYPHVLRQIERLSKDRGLPVIFPLYDLQDNKVVSVSDVWGHFFEHIDAYSQRYNVDALVISRFWYEQPGSSANVGGTQAPVNEQNWKLQWRLYEQGKLIENHIITGELNRLMALLVNTMADKYAAEYAVDSLNLDNASRIVLTVRNVSDITHLMAAEKLLMSFSAVADVLLKTINNDVAEFEIVLVGELLDLLQGLDLERHLVKDLDPLARKADSQTLEFRWVP
ncbi:MAG: hypothetical protein ACI9FJ_001770 [Alteromonadaceae bacterium]